MSEAFPSKFLKAADLGGREIEVEMAEVQIEELGDDRKPVLYFHGKKKGMVLNKTNAGRIAAAFGDDSDDWNGKKIILYPDVVDFQGKMTDCLRVRVPGTKADAEEVPF